MAIHINNEQFGAAVWASSKELAAAKERVQEYIKHKKQLSQWQMPECLKILYNVWDAEIWNSSSTYYW